MKKSRITHFLPFVVIAFLLTNANSSNAQTYFGIKKINIYADFAFATPKNALVTPGGYGLGNVMQLYYGVEVPFAYIGYGKKSSMGIIIAGILDHEKANFSSSLYGSDGMDAKLTSLGARVRPFSGMRMFDVKESELHDGKDYTTTEKHVSQEGEKIVLNNGQSVTATEWTETKYHQGFSTAESKSVVYLFLSGLYFDYGFAKAALIEPPTPTVNRTPNFWGWGCAPAIVVGRKTTFYIDLGWRKYSWTNSLNTKSSINSFRCGFGLGFALNTSKKK